MKVNDLAAGAAVVRWSGLTNVSMVLNSSEALVYNPYSDQGAWQSYTDNSGSSVSIGSWTHVTMVRSNNTMKYYYNGVLAETDTLTDNPTSSVTGVFAFGSTTSAQYFGGTLDEIRVYNRALSPNEVSALYNWAPGPVAYYPMDETASIATILDKSGYANNATTYGSMTSSNWVAGKFGKALDFNGTTQYISPGAISNLHKTGFTFGGWMKIDSQPGYYSSMLMALPSGVVLYYNQSSLTLDSQIYNGTTNTHVTCTNAVSLGTWHYMSLTFDPTSNLATAYQDGKKCGSATISGGMNSAYTTTPTIGKYSSYYHDGLIDEVKIYNYARTPGQIVEDMNGGHPLGGSPIGSQVIHWKFDEGYGSSTNNTVSSNNTGTISGSTWATNSNCKINNCLLNSANSDVISIPTASDSEVDFNGSESFSSSAWIYVSSMVNSGQYDAIIAKWDESNSQRAYRLVITNDDGDSYGQLQASIYDESADQAITATSNNNTISLNTWYHVLMTFNGGSTGAAGDLKIYINGKLSGSNTANVSFLGLEDVTSDFTVANYDVNDGLNTVNTAFAGYIDEVKIYSAALTPEQIAIDMNANSAADFGSTSKEKSTLLDGAGADPVGYWDFNENTGTTTVYDKSGNGNNGTMNGSMTESDWVRGPKGKGSALEFDGVNDRVIVTNPTQDDFGTGSLSVSAWINTTSSGSQKQIIDNKNAGTADAGFNLQLMSDGSIYLRIANGSAQIGATMNTKTVNDGSWHHILGTIDRGVSADVFKIYVDGVLEKTLSTATSVGWNISSSQNLVIGAFGSGYFYGSIDDVKLWNYALTPAQVAYEYNRGAPVGWWKLDECQGSTVYDASGKGNNGTITIGATGTNTSLGTCNSGTSTEAWNNGSSGKVGSSLSFDGTDDVITIGDKYDIGNNDISITSWIKTTDSTNQQWIIAKSDGSSSDGRWALGTYLGKVRAYIDPGTSIQVDGNTQISDGNWHNIITVIDRSDKMFIYVDGVLDNSGDISSSSSVDLQSTMEVNIGRRLSTNYFAGLIDDVRIYNYALSPTQIKTIYNGGAIKFGN